MKLSKTNFLIYRDCAHNAWVRIHAPDIYRAKPLSLFEQELLKTGNEVDDLARELFPHGVLVGREDAAGTALLVAERTLVLYQPVFETERFSIACDILEWDAAHGVYDLYEVKSSTNGNDKKAKDELYTYDLAFQAEVLRANGVPLGRFMLVRLNSDYMRAEALDVEALFAIEDFSERVATISDAMAGEMATAHQVLQSETPLRPPCSCMTKGRSAHCTCFSYVNPMVPDYSVHDISRIGLSKRKLTELLDRGILAVADVPDDFELSEAQANQVRAAKTGEAMTDNEAIADFLGAMAFPVAFLDYETYPCAVPRFAGYGPYDHIPFQFSVDVIDRPGGELVHHEFLHTTPDCPDRALLAALEAAMPKSGSIVVWNQAFERGINDQLAERNSSVRDFLGGVDVRIVDLMDVFAMQAYVHPEFRGKTSIKNILPVLVPELSYKALAIQEGGTATAKWNEIVTGAMDAATIARTRADLLAYCGLDTRAMVEIWRVLARLVSSLEVDRAG